MRKPRDTERQLREQLLTTTVAQSANSQSEGELLRSPRDIAATLRPNEVAAAYGSRFTVSSLAKMRLQGSGPPFCRIGRSIVYVRSDFDEWLGSRRRKSTSDSGEAA